MPSKDYGGGGRVAVRKPAPAPTTAQAPTGGYAGNGAPSQRRVERDYDGGDSVSEYGVRSSPSRSTPIVAV